jgi:phosphoglycerate kinase
VKTLKEFNLKNKRVLVRCDFNVPLSEKGVILDDFRIKKTIPTIEYLIGKGGKVILMSHLGDPEGKVVESLRLTPIQDKLMEYLDLSITKAPDCLGKEIENWTKEMESGEILLLENLRFHKEEEENDKNFAQQLARLGDIYINEAFSVCHRNHASVVGITKYLPSAAGFLLEEEVKILSRIMEKPERPLVVIVGGAKVKDKAKTIERFSEIGDLILVGNLIGREIKEKKLKVNPEKIILPIFDEKLLDLNKRTIEIFKEKISLAKTIFWAGPLGKIEEEKYQKGTKEIARAIVESGAFSVIGGGDTIEFINKIGLIEKFNHVSIGGGAMLEFLAGEKLPGLMALNFYEEK